MMEVDGAEHGHSIAASYNVAKYYMLLMLVLFVNCYLNTTFTINEVGQKHGSINSHD